MKNRQPESRLQRDIISFILAAGFRAVHVPNGSKLAGTPEQRARAGARLKADGLVPGFPDLLIYGPGQRIGHIEVKAPAGRVQDTQRACQAWLEALEHKYAVCRSTDDVARTLREWGWL